MNAPGRNDPCPCGSGKKYKKCCLDKSGVEKPVAVQHTGGQAAIEQLIQAALAHQHAGRLQEAAELYQQVLQLAPQSPDALHLLGLIKHQTCEHQAAIDLISRAIEISPSTALYYCNAGLVLQTLGQQDVALACYQKALELQPEFVEALNNLGNLMQDQGNTEEAAVKYRAALSLKPDFAEAHYNLGNVFRAKSQMEESIVCYQAALQYKKNYPEAHNNIGVALAELGRYEEALPSYYQALAQLPGYVDAQINLGAALERLGRFEEARGYLQRSLELSSDHADAYCNLGNLERSLGQLNEAVDNYQKALLLDPNHAESYNNLGSVFLDLGRHDEAQAFFWKAVEIAPTFAEAYYNFARVLAEKGKFAECISYSEKALALKCFAGPYLNIGFAKRNLNCFAESIAAYREALRLNPAHAGAYSNLLLTMLYDFNTTPADLFAESLNFAERYEAPYLGCRAKHTNTNATGRRLKVGYVSADFRNHSIAYFIEQILTNHNKAEFEIYCYYNHSIHDGITERLRKLADHWLPCIALNDEQLTSRIQADGIDILVDLSGHTGGNRLQVFARKPAPVQVTWMGYVGTTGLSSMDYRFTDAYLDPVGASERYHTEALVRLPSGVSIFRSAPNAPEVNTLPALSGEGFTFANLNILSKLNERVIALWARILNAVPGSRIMLGNAESPQSEWVLDLFERYGVGSGRILLQPRVGILDYLALHHQIDLALDPFPYNGGTTTLHSLWMGVPVLTLSGDKTISRVGASIMKGFGLSQFVVDSEEAYFERAVELSRNVAELDELRHGLRACIASNTTCDAAGYTRAVEAAYRNMWQQWCEQRVAE